MLPKNRSLDSFIELKINFRGKACLNVPEIGKGFSGLRAFSLKYKLIY